MPIRSIIRWFASRKSRDRDADLALELREHLARDVERHVARGLTPAAAAALARREFGNLAAIEESARDSWRLERLDDAVRAVRLAFRALLLRPTFTVTAAASLGLGLGAATTVFTVVNTLLLRPLPYRDAAALVSIWPAQTVANREVAYLRKNAHSYAMVASFSPGWLMPLTGITEARQVDAAKVSGNFFALLGAVPMLGRTFGMDAETPGSDRLAVLSEDLWTNAFRRDPAIIGRSIMLEGAPATVVAVMPRSFRLLDTQADLWVPMAMDPAAMAWAGATTIALGELRPGVAAPAASAELRVLAAQMQRDFEHAPSWNQSVTVTSLQSTITGSARGALTLLLLAVSFLLLLAVVNVVNLVLVRTAEREQELAVRTSLGATAHDVRVLLLTEGFLLSGLGGLLGVGATIGGVGLLRAVLPPTTPRVAELAIDLRVLGVALVLTLLVGALFALAPTRQIRQGMLAAPLRSGRGITRRGNRTRGALVAVEFSLALLLATGAALMARTLEALYHVDRGIRTDNVLTMLVQRELSGDSTSRVYWHQVLEAVAGVAGVKSAATMLHLPMSGRSWHADVTVEGRPLEPGTSPPRTAWQSVSTDYFSVVGLPITAGRGFTAADGPDAPPVIVVNRAFARAIFGTADPVGKRIQAGFATGTEWATIVAVVADMPHDSLNVPPTPEVYVPMDQRMVGATSLIVRTTGDPRAVAAAVRRTIAAIDRNVPVSSGRAMNDLYTAALQVPRTLLSVLLFFAVAGVLLSAVGVYGLVAYGVRQRRREIGIRAALGADSAGLQWVFVREAIRNAIFGLAAGVPIAVVGLRAMRSHVFGVATSDPATLAGVALLLTVVALTASWIPARRAARISPATVLQES